MTQNHSGFDLHKFSGFEIHATKFAVLLALCGGKWYNVRVFKGRSTLCVPDSFENAMVRELIGSINGCQTVTSFSAPRTKLFVLLRRSGNAERDPARFSARETKRGQGGWNVIRIAKCVLTVIKRGFAITSVVIIGGIVGCASQRDTQYVDPGEIVAGTPDKPTMYDLESSAQQLMDKMLASPQFSINYNAAKASKGRLPIAVIGNIENKTKERVQGRLDAVGDTIRAALFSSAPFPFEVKDDAAADAIKSRIIRGADGGLENGALVQTMGTQDSPDFIVLGDLRHFTDVGGYHTYRLRLAIHNLSTGKVVWEGIQTKIKL